MIEVEVVSQRFLKFFNYAEPLAATIDWSTARVTEKKDGSIIGGWYDEGTWHFSTNGVIDAFKCDLQLPSHDCASFGDLFVIAATETSGKDWGEFLQVLDPSIMYTWELTTPFNRVVVPYKENRITLIGARDKTHLKEIDVWTRVDLLPDIPRPNIYSMKSMEEILSILPTLPYSEEGYVIMDAQFNRIKMKSLSYVAAHRLKDNGNVNPKRVLELIKANEQDEFISYFPEYKDHFDRIKEKYNHTMVTIAAALAATDEWKKILSNKKDFAMKVLAENVKLRKYMFAAWDGKDVQALINDISYDDLL